jgi:anti-sigma regulatory factor (Ser/Thr protein kinase)
VNGTTGRPGNPVGVETTLSPDPGEVPRSRRVVREALGRWGLRLDEDIALLLVSELVTNALLHGRPPLHLRAMPVRNGLRVEVHDGAPDARPARLAGGALPDTRGRGLTIVSALASRWGTGASAHGKQVWFELDGSR